MHAPRSGGLAILAALGVAVLLAVHVFMLHQVTSHASIPAAASVGLVVVLVAKHVGLFAAIHRRLRPRS